jgi:membrane protein
MLRKRAASFGMVGVIGALLLASTTLNVSLALLASKAPAAFSILGDPALLAVTGQLVTLCVVAITFAAVFKVLPDVNVEWRDVWIGAIATAVLFVAGETAISLYFRFSDVASGYGATGSLLVVLLWIYYSAALLLLGAEFTKVHAGKVATTVSATISILDERPAGVDPRAVRAEGRKLP